MSDKAWRYLLAIVGPLCAAFWVVVGWGVYYLYTERQYALLAIIGLCVIGLVYVVYLAVSGGGDE